MRRRPIGRDARLTVRIATVLASLAGLLVALAFGFVFVFQAAPDWWPYWTAVAVVLAGATLVRYRTAERLLLASAAARLTERGEEPELAVVVERLSGLADIIPPRIAVSDSEIPTAFAVGLTQQRAAIAVSAGLQAALEPRELEAVIAHEVAHIANRDASVMTLASVPRTLGSLLLGRDEQDLSFYLWFFLWPVGLFLWGVSSLLTLALSRYRDYVADRGAAFLTGAPQQLMAALQKISDGIAKIPARDLREASDLNALFIVPVHARLAGLMREHPPLEERLSRLSEIASEMGKPVL